MTTDIELEQVELDHQHGGWDAIPAALWTDDRLNANAVRLFGWLLSRPPGWQVRWAQAQDALGMGRDARKTAVRQLVDAGWLVVAKPEHDDAGRFLPPKLTTHPANAYATRKPRSAPAPGKPSTVDPSPGEPSPGEHTPSHTEVVRLSQSDGKNLSPEGDGPEQQQQLDGIEPSAGGVTEERKVLRQMRDEVNQRRTDAGALPFDGGKAPVQFRTQALRLMRAGHERADIVEVLAAAATLSNGAVDIAHHQWRQANPVKAAQGEQESPEARRAREAVARVTASADGIVIDR